MGKRAVIARLRPKKDDDIKRALEQLPRYIDESDIVRAALRKFLFGQDSNITLGKIDLKAQSDEQMIIEPTPLEDDDDELEANIDKFIKD